MADTTSIREAENRVIIEGTLKENNLQLDVKNGKTKIMGELVIQTGSEKELHTIKMLAMELKADGSENGLFKSLKTVMEDYKSIASVGIEEADRVRITAGKLGLNEYYDQSGTNLKTYQQVSTNFINRLAANEEMTPRAEFEVEIYISSISEEVKGEENTGRLIIKSLIPIYGGRIIPFNFIVADEELIDAVQSSYEKGCTVKIFGDLLSTIEVTKSTVGTAIGKGREKIVKTAIKEFIFTSGELPYEEDNANRYDREVIKKAYAERELYLQELKKKKTPGTPAPSQKNTGAVNKGSGVKATGAGAKKAPTPTSAPKVEDDLPF